MRVQSDPTVPSDHVAFTNGGGDVIVYPAGCVVTGWSVRETTGTSPASITIFDGSSSGGDPVISISLLANESIRELAPDGGILFGSGVCVNAFFSQCGGTIWLKQLPAQGG